MLKRDELVDPTSCLNKAAEDEPVFVLRANDELAPYVVEEWAQCRANQRGLYDPKAVEARALADRMREWKRKQEKPHQLASLKGLGEHVNCIVVVRGSEIMVVTNETIRGNDRAIAGFLCKHNDRIQITANGLGIGIFVEGKQVVSPETIRDALLNQDQHWEPDAAALKAAEVQAPVAEVQQLLQDLERPPVAFHADGSVERHAEDRATACGPNCASDLELSTGKVHVNPDGSWRSV